MKTLYEASNAIEAQMLLDLLQQEGLTAQIRGDYLQGAAGGLPAAGLVRLEIDEADYAKARTVIERWEAAQRAEPKPKPAARHPVVFYGFLLGLAIGIAGCYIFYRAPSTRNGIDYNGDGSIDEKWTYALSGVLLKYEFDRNLDGKVDFISHFDANGLSTSAESDDDFDGVFETRLRYRNGSIEYSEVDTDGDGFADLRSHSANGVLSTIEYLSPKNGFPQRVEHYKLGKLISAQVDTDNDGKLDTEYTYDPLGERNGPVKMSK
jgi:Putative prokaryotic signal transducing protein